MRFNLTIDDQPVRHVIADNAFPASLIQEANLAWPTRDWPGWIWCDYAGGTKRACDLSRPLPVQCGVLLARMAQLPVAHWFPEVATVPDLSLYGAGLHQMTAGPGLARHQDADTHARLGLARVLSAVLYVHGSWQEDWGGQLAMDGLSIAPLPGRLVVFDCRTVAHAVQAIVVPGGARRSLAMFWYAPDVGPNARVRAAF